MKHALSMLKNEDGSALLLAAVLLFLVTVIGVTATTTSMTEVQTVAREKTYRQNFFRGEGSAVLAAQILENETNTRLLENLPYGQDADSQWLRRDKTDLPDPVNIYNPANWATGLQISGTAIDPETGNPIDPNSRFLAIYKGVAGGASANMGTTQKVNHEYKVYGRGQRQQTAVVIEICYRKRF